MAPHVDSRSAGLARLSISKAHTSLRRVIERILSGVDGPASRGSHTAPARDINGAVFNQRGNARAVGSARAASPLRRCASIGDLKGAELDELREKAGRLIGDYTFKETLSRPGGPVERITNLALHGTDPAQDVNEHDLHLSADDLQIDLEDLSGAGTEVGRLVRALSNTAFRTLRLCSTRPLSRSGKG